MEKIIETCLICGEYMGTFKNEMTVPTGFSERPIFQMFESCMGLKLPLDIVESAGVCQNCFIKFNEIDEHQMIAEKLQMELLSLFNSNSTAFTEVKEEEDVKEDIAITESIEDTIVQQTSDEIIEEFYVGDEEIVIAEEEDMKHFELSDNFEKKPQTIVYKTSPKEGGAKRQYTRRKDPDAGLTMVLIDGERLYQCDVCQRVCKDRYKLKNHRETHTTERNVCCTECGAMFKTLGCLYSHRKLHKERVYHDCDLCGMKYSQKTQLRKHMEAIHLKRKDYVCQLCGKSYSRDTTLSKHMFVHKEEKDFECPVCGFKTHTRPKLERHMKSHTGERNYSCGICGKKFLYSYNVIAHVRYVHNREKRVYDESKTTCHVCGKKFQKIWKVKEHLAEVHNIQETHEEEEIVVDQVVIE